MADNPDKPNQIPAILGGLENSIKALTARLEAMQGRDPSGEFAYGAFDVFNQAARFSYPRIEKLTTVAARNTTAWTDGTMIFQASLSPLLWRIKWMISGTSLDNAAFYPVLQLEFGTTKGFSPPVFQFPNIISSHPTSYTANTGGILAIFNEDWPLRYTHLRVTAGLINSSTNPPKFVATQPSSMNGYGAGSPLEVQIMGT